ncbi:MAG: hypothetical protein CBB97_19285, partial [Candidatus Endolissoclinum sp. TMED37]
MKNNSSSELLGFNEKFLDIFSQIPKIETLNYCKSLKFVSKRLIKINVWRNHTFEYLEELSNSFRFLTGLECVFNYSHYDHSMSFELHEKSDLEIIWFDLDELNNMGSNEKISWIATRLEELRVISSSPVLVCLISDEMIQQPVANIALSIPETYIIDIRKLVSRTDCILFDLRLKKIAGSKLSRDAMKVFSKTLYLKYLPSLFSTEIKGIIVDLDNTIHQGILGEDGLEGISISKDYSKLQKFLKKKKERGIMLALVSKNIKREVIDLLNLHPDYKLKPEDFTHVCASWNSKSEAIKDILDDWNVSPDSVIFVDDNPGELISVHQELKELNLVPACYNPTLTKDIIEFFPGNFKIYGVSEDLLRSVDIVKNLERKRLSITKNDEEFYKELKISLVFEINNLSNIGRAVDLFNKTNQFNLNLRRTKKSELINLFKHQTKTNFSSVITISLSDKFSESGIIGALLLNICIEKKTIIISEAVISCRALGRRLEDIIMIYGIKLVAKNYENYKISFLYKKGVRNEPALKWLSNFFNFSISKDGCYSVDNVLKINHFKT